MTRSVTRRETIQILGAVTAGAALPACDADGMSGARGLDGGLSDVGRPDSGPTSGLDAGPGEGGLTDAGAQDAAGVDGGQAPSCVLTPEQVEGPYFVDTGFERVDITEDRTGLPVRVRFTVLDAVTCAPIEGAAVELWHADAGGAYSGFDKADGNLEDYGGLTFLRGFQVSDARGKVEFQSIYPGWYPGRAPHVHLSVLVDGDKLVTTQCYFDDLVSDVVYAQAPYDRRGPHDTRNVDDFVSRFGGAPGTDPLLFDLEASSDGYDASFVLAVARP